MRHALCLLLLLMGSAWPARQAEAVTQCTATATPLLFPAAGVAQVDSASTVTVTCNTFGLSLIATTRVRMCLSLDGGSVAPAQAMPRLMRNAFGDPLEFQIYRNAGRTAVWGGLATPSSPNPVQIDLEYAVPLLGGTGTTTLTLYGRVPAQPAAASGTYLNVFSPGNATLTYRYAEALLLTPQWPPTCLSGGTGGRTVGYEFAVSAPVASRCTLSSATDLDFGNVPGVVRTDRDQTSTVTFTCTGRTAWNVGLDNGLHATGAMRRMRRGTSPDYVRYDLYRDAPRSLRWGTTAGTDTASGLGTGAPQSVTIHGRVPAGQTVPAGSYTDTVTVTVDY